MNIDLSKCKLPPYDHQRVGIEALVTADDVATKRTLPGCFALFDEMGAGKTLQVIAAMQVLYEQNVINRVLVIAPAAVRSVWFDPELGELRKHLWATTPVRVVEYHQKERTWTAGPESKDPLVIVITNYDYVRLPTRRKGAPPINKTIVERFNRVSQFCNARTMMVLDESSAVKNHKSAQTKTCMKLRVRCGRVVLLNGTPIANNPLDLFAQGQLMDKRIFDVQTFTAFRAKYAVVTTMSGFPKVTDWQNLEDLQTRLAPYVLRRLKVDCLDLPEKMDPVTITVPMTETTWRHYKQMRDELVVWLENNTISAASHAVIKILRLAQITSGFLGGIEEITAEEARIHSGEYADPLDNQRPTWMPSLRPSSEPQQASLPMQELREGTIRPATSLAPVEIGREKLDIFLANLDLWLEADPNLHLLVWCRFRPELARLLDEMRRRGDFSVGAIHGGQKREDREAAIRLLDPRTSPKGPTIVAGTPASGSMGLNLTAANRCVYISNDFSLKTRLQSEDRVHRPGQTRAVSYFDVVATGPKGQKTVDHAVIKALREKESIANWTASAWIRALRDE